MIYIGKEVTNLVSVCKVKNGIYYNLDFIGNFKALEIKVGARCIYKVEGRAKTEVSDDPIKLVEEVDLYDELGKNATLSSPVHIKKTYRKYKWLDENGFIGPDDTLILRNRNQYSLFKNCLEFLEEASEYIKVDDYRDRMTVYKFHKYGIDGKIKKHKDGQGEIKLDIPGGENKISFGYYVNGIAHSQRMTNYKTRDLTECERYRFNELNKIIVGLGLKEIISKS